MLFLVGRDFDLASEGIVITYKTPVLPGLIIKHFIMLLVKVIFYLLAGQLIEFYKESMTLVESTYLPYSVF